MKRLFFLLFLSSLNIQLFAQEKFQLEGLVGTNYAYVKDGVSDPNRHWYPGAIAGIGASYNLSKKFTAESGLFYEMIRIGYYEHPGGFNDPTVNTVVNGYDYINIPLNLAFGITKHFAIYSGFGYRFELGGIQKNYFKKYSTEPLFNIGTSYKIDEFKLSLGYSTGLRDGMLGLPQGLRNRTYNFSVSYPFLKK